MRRNSRLPLLVTVLVALLAMAFVSRAQDGTPEASGATGRGGATASEAARSAAQNHLGLLSGGDWSGAWDGWSSDAKQRVPRATYVRAGQACHPLLAVPLQTARAVPVNDRTVDVDWQGGGASGTLRMVYEDGRWRVATPPAQRCGLTSTPAPPAPSAG
ncbi:hypothetical protein AMK26_06050 [Streptomyces sp. CB03234]|uniref:hypothetical protein n=1 Tax=Streptomyces sp. (strain CB03234) TaxID=1703937 RepID=UPI0009399F58|nr:hypothetical protein [Streptomyces sp. CB03234]OKK08549.1 hypothetical protein AMK26_06050 [Streptomyces sp. CB03234]